jgi:predicted alpha/beta superfamily hydrolase
MTRSSPAFSSRSEAPGTRYAVYVDAPASGTGPWPVVLVTDGDVFFDPAVEASRALEKAGAIPPLLVVGVGYGAFFGQPGNHRGRDYTPTASAEEPSSGGADAFLSYLEGTLWGELRDRYPVDEATRAIAGHSLGSLLVLHALFQDRPFFNRALASAPSVWWDNRSILRLIGALRDRRAALEGRLYLGVGAEDTPSMTADMGLLAAQLSDRPFGGLRVLSETLPGRDHFDVAPHTLAAGLAFLFGAE